MSGVSKEWIEKALKTYDNPNWPADCPVTPAELAGAGLFYTGRDDVVRCGYCGGRLQAWCYGESPLETHEYVFPGCKYEGEPEFRTCMRPMKEETTTEEGEKDEASGGQ